MDRTELMEQHRAARERREAAPWGSDAFRAAAEDVARIEIAIAALEEPPPAETAPAAAAAAEAEKPRRAARKRQASGPPPTGA